MRRDPGSGEELVVIDIHQHLDPDDEGTTGTLARRFRVNREAGIDHVVVLPPSGAFGRRDGDRHDLNRSISRLVAERPDRILCGVGQVDPGDGLPVALDAIDHAVRDLGLRGIAWHHRFEGRYLDHPDMVGLVRRCGEHGVPALIHVIAGSGMEASWRLERLLEQCPHTQVIALDAFSGVDRAEEVMAIAERHPNLSCDLGAMLSIAGWIIKRFVERLGHERLLLGTDLYMQPQTWHSPAPLLEVLHLDIPPEAKRSILAGNALRLFGFETPATTAGVQSS